MLLFLLLVYPRNLPLKVWSKSGQYIKYKIRSGTAEILMTLSLWWWWWWVVVGGGLKSFSCQAQLLS